MDVGVGTGHPLFSIINKIPKETYVLGIDIDRNYIPAAKKIFQNHKNVEIQEKNFYEMAKSTEKFDVIIFSSSFMLMPQREKALEIAKDRLNDNGRIYFLMTLYTSKGPMQKAMGFVKPYLKYLTTIDFGEITYEDEFISMMKNCGMSITSMEKLKSKNNVFYNNFKMNVIETEKAKIWMNEWMNDWVKE